MAYWVKNLGEIKLQSFLIYQNEHKKHEKSQGQWNYGTIVIRVDVNFAL